MDKSKSWIYYASVALVFVVYYFLTGSSDAVGSTIRSVLLVGLASIVTWMVIREQKNRGRHS